MDQPLRGRLLVAFALLFALFASTIAPAFAVTTGSITGQVTDTSGKPLGGVSVSVAAPSDRRTATTDDRGFYAITGLNSDTFTVTFSLAGYDLATVAGVTVFPDQQQQVNSQLQRSLQRIGRTSARSTVGAFQPTQTLDTYSVNPKKLDQLLGKSGAISESALVYALPGSQNAGNPSLRGGRTNQIGWSWEGLTDIDPSTNQFTNLQLNGVQTVQLTPGAGAASNATAGTGTVNITVKRGTRPPFGSLQVEGDLNRFRHALIGEYGFATPDNRWSSYFSFSGSNQAALNGPYGVQQALINNYLGTDYTNRRDIVSNTVYKFGKDQSQSLQFVLQDQVVTFGLDTGGWTNLAYDVYDQLDLQNLTTYTSQLYPRSGTLTAAQVQRLAPLLPNQTRGITNIAYADAQTQPPSKLKLEYDNQINSSTTLAVRLSRINSVTVFDLHSAAQGALYQLQGGYRTGGQIDLTKQLNDRNLLTTGVAYSFEQPIIDSFAPDTAIFDASGAGRVGGGQEIFDFIKLQPGEKCGARDASQCGYLYTQPQFANAAQLYLPIYNRVRNIPRGVTSVYVDDAISFGRRAKLDLGVRDDFESIKYPTTQPYQNASVLQPRVSFAYQLSNADAVRASYGRTVNFPQLSNIQAIISQKPFAQFAGIPSFNVAACAPAQVVGTGTGQCNPGTNPAKNCGINGTTLCKDYADQLYWEYQLSSQGAALYQPLKPETFSNWDASYSHQFRNNVGLKITPFFRRGFDVSALAQTPLLDANGNPQYSSTGSLLLNPAVSTNLGIERSTGAEFLLTKDTDFGFSGQLAMTYVNEITNSIPLSTQENVFPRIPLPSILLGHTYRAGYVSPFVATGIAQYQSRAGFRVNTILSYNKGYPIGSGTLASIFVNGRPVDVPLTDLTLGASARSSTAQYVDPSNPGSFTKPNIAASLGTPEAPSPGGVLNNPRLNATFTTEYTRPGSRNTIGIQVTNLFNNLYARAARNNVQPVATGVFGPSTGNLTRAQAGAAPNAPYLANTPDFSFRQLPYFINANQQPLTTTVYYGVKF